MIRTDAQNVLRSRYENYSVNNPIVNPAPPSFVQSSVSSSSPSTPSSSPSTPSSSPSISSDLPSSAPSNVLSSSMQNLTIECEVCGMPIPFQEYDSHHLAHDLENDDASSASNSHSRHHHSLPSTSLSSPSISRLLSLPVTSNSSSTSTNNGVSQTINIIKRNMGDGQEFVVTEEIVNGRIVNQTQEIKHQTPNIFHPQQTSNIFHTQQISPLMSLGLGMGNIMSNNSISSISNNLDGMDYDSIIQLENRLGKVKVGFSSEQFSALPRFQWAYPSTTSGTMSSPAPSSLTSTTQARVNQPEDKMCPICQSDFEGGEDVICTPCMHKFHPDCLWGWLKDNISCPICKEDLRNFA